ncbi:hypothetical protein [Kitasatospora sp. NPDC086791]|uniref:hypothetical protein n=1 Tax=Kitasatospora sp. NPDC086791 TaxID=3155178 RepID=UPI00343FECC6
MEFLVQRLVADLLADLEKVSDGPLPEHLVVRWNLLTDVLGPWEDQPGWDGERWRRIPDAAPFRPE